MVITKPGSMVVSAREGAFYRVEYSLVEAGLRTAVDPVPSSISFSHNACFGLAASEHRMIWVAAAS